MEALLRRSAPPRSASVLRVEDLRLDLLKKIAWMGERRIALTPREFALLACLMENAGTVVTREELLRRVWNLKFDPGTKVIDVYIRFLRRKIERPGTKPLIQTVRGFGYKITPPDDR